MRRMLVTGAAGFIGTNFVHFWAEHHSGDAIVGLDALTYAGNLANLEPLANNERFTFIKGDIRDGDTMRDIIKHEGIDTIVHFAAESHVDRSIHGPDPFIDTNVRGTHELLKAARAAWTEDWSGGARRFHHISTDEVYGSLGPTAAPFTEDTAYAPNSPYAASKAGSDHLVRAYHHTYGLPVTTTNCSNNYGPYHFPEKLIPLTIVNALDGKPLPLYGDGLQIRDWLYVRDHCRGIERVLEAGRLGETYNVGGWNEQTNLSVVHTICDLLDELQAKPQGSYRDQIKHITDRPGHDRRYAIDARKIERELGWKPAETFETGLRKTVEWYLANDAWVAQVQSGEYTKWVDLQYKNKEQA